MHACTDSSQPTDQLFNAKPTESRQKRSANRLGSSKSKKRAIMSEVSACFLCLHLSHNMEDCSQEAVSDVARFANLYIYLL